jgi:ABC-type glutathione transport system ATPase component
MKRGVREPGKHQPDARAGVENVPNVGASLESREVRKSCGIPKDRLVRAAHDVSLTIEAGAFVALTTASGSSKSTLVTATAALFPARALHRLPPPAYSPKNKILQP